MPDKTWKKTERWFAHQLRGERAGPGIRQRFGDIITPLPLAVEVKDGAQIPKFVTDSLGQAIRASVAWRELRNTEKAPITIQHPFGHSRDLTPVLMWFRDLKRLLDLAYPIEYTDPSE